MCINLTHKGWAKLKSMILLNVIGGILKKIESLLKSFTEQMIDIGKAIVEKISEVAYLWGNKDAIKWKDDSSFSFYWGLLKFNSPTMAHL
ncbi:MAG: hypothetical protein RMJ31_06860 [Nitrososphaerota archaeon]|nr:hypothetical protein [Nitrososphaerota archaeon]